MHGWVQRGFSLIEVLVALVILAVGVLGLAALQTTGLQFTHDAYIRSQATVVVYDLVERMRNNVSNANSYIAAADPAGICDVTAGGVTNDLNCWFETLAAQLPQGAGSIAADPGNLAG
ncbi:MAG: type IV pilus modification protein PilV [Gammaproteobacteria bacterium]|nr:type IV pilus modification protein PilV [Gammaproteobacteria bacterium]